MTATDPTQSAAPPAPGETAKADQAAADIWNNPPEAPPVTVDPAVEWAAQIAAAQAQAEQYRQDYLRVLADNENQRRRAQRELEQARQFALERFAQALLPVGDALEMALAAGLEPGADVAQLREGDVLTLKLLGEVFAKVGISEVNPLNERFNPEHHEAMGMEATPGAAPNSVVKVYQKGYLLNGRLLRPARVVIAKPGQDA